MSRSAQLWWGSGVLLAAVALGVALTASGPARPSALDSAWNDLMIHARPDLLVGFARVMNVVGGGWVAGVIAPLCIAAVLLIVRRWRSAVFLLVALVASAGMVQVLKRVFGRARPEEMLVLSDFGSFPSGHTANAATLAVVVWLLFPRAWAAALGVLWVLAMALSRTLLSVHWLTDTVGGVMAGVGAALLIGAALLPWVRPTADAAADRLSGDSHPS